MRSIHSSHYPIASRPTPTTSINPNHIHPGPSMATVSANPVDRIARSPIVRAGSERSAVR